MGKMTKTGADLDEKIKTHIDEALKKMDIPTKKDIQELNKKLDQIAKKI
jgi:polyhydroxyalkanoate synthesis regulator phasin